MIYTHSIGGVISVALLPTLIKPMTVIVNSTQCLLCSVYNHLSYDVIPIRCVKIEAVPDSIVLQQETFHVKPALVLLFLSENDVSMAIKIIQLAVT